jgi:hypothetical protein
MESKLRLYLASSLRWLLCGGSWVDSLGVSSLITPFPFSAAEAQSHVTSARLIDAVFKVGAGVKGGGKENRQYINPCYAWGCLCGAFLHCYIAIFP